jgi:hypothetical protein
MIYSEVMRTCGLDPNYDTGPFNYHISVLLDSNLIKKEQNRYQLTNLGEIIARFILTIQRECRFLLKTEKEKEVKKQMEKIESKWLNQEDINKQEHGFIAGPVKTPLVEKKEEYTQERQKFYNLQKKIPQLEVPPPSFFGHTIGYEKNAVKLGSIHLRFHVRSATNIATAQILGIYTVDNNYKKIGETRQSLLRKMMNELLEQLQENGTEQVEIDRAYSEDQDLVNVLKDLDFKRISTSYLMRKTIN